MIVNYGTSPSRHRTHSDGKEINSKLTAASSCAAAASAVSAPPAARANTLMGGLRAELGSFQKTKIEPSNPPSSTTGGVDYDDDNGNNEKGAASRCCRCGTCHTTEPAADESELAELAEPKQPSLRIVDNAIVMLPRPPQPQCPGNREEDADDEDGEAATESLRSIGGITDELIRTKLELAALKEKSSRVLNAAHQKEEVLTRRVETLGRAKEKFRKIARRLSNVPELAMSKQSASAGGGGAGGAAAAYEIRRNSAPIEERRRRRRSASDDRASLPPSLAAALTSDEPFRFRNSSSPVHVEPRRRRSASGDRAALSPSLAAALTVDEPFRFLCGLSEEKCDYVPPPAKPSRPKGSSRTIDPDELLWSRTSSICMEFDPTGGSARKVAAAVGGGNPGGTVPAIDDMRNSLTRGISFKRLRDHLGTPMNKNALAAAAIADQAMTEAQRALMMPRSASLHRRRGSTFW